LLYLKLDFFENGERIVAKLLALLLGSAFLLFEVLRHDSCWTKVCSFFKGKKKKRRTVREKHASFIDSTADGNAFPFAIKRVLVDLVEDKVARWPLAGRVGEHVHERLYSFPAESAKLHLFTVKSMGEPDQYNVAVGRSQ